jgi:hypothetical protein
MGHRAAALHRRAHGPLDATAQIAPPLNHVHRNQLIRKAGRFGLVTKVKFANRRHRPAIFTQQMMPALDPPIVGMRIAPILSFEHMLARCDNATRRNTNGRIRIRIGESCSASRQLVEIRRAHEIVAHTAQRPALLLVGHDEQHISRLH